QYDPSCRITGNNFDIGAYEQISSAQKQEMLKELVGYIIANGFTTINDFTVAAMNDFDGCYWEIIVGYNGTLERYCRGNYLKRKAKAEARDAGE
ncbi:replication protein, partial [Megasphaera massiliensis]